MYRFSPNSIYFWIPEKGGSDKVFKRVSFANPGILQRVDPYSPRLFSEVVSPTVDSGMGAWTGVWLPELVPDNCLRHRVDLPPETEPGEDGRIAGGNDPDLVLGTGPENRKAP